MITFPVTALPGFIFGGSLASCSAGDPCRHPHAGAVQIWLLQKIVGKQGGKKCSPSILDTLKHIQPRGPAKGKHFHTLSLSEE